MNDKLLQILNESPSETFGDVDEIICVLVKYIDILEQRIDILEKKMTTIKNRTDLLEFRR
jgi:hypothetical protein